MNEPDHRELRESLGYYVLGLLAAEERPGVAAHVAGCTPCRAQVTALQPLVGRLAHVDPQRLDHVPEPPRDLADAIIAGIRAERAESDRADTHRAATDRSRGVHRLARRLPVLLAAAVLTVSLGFGAAWVLKPTPVPDSQSVALQIAVDSDVESDARLVNHAWGMEVLLDGTGFTAGEAFRVMVMSRDGSRSSAGSFVGVGDAALACRLTTDVLQQDTVGFQVLDEGGRPVAWSNWG